MQITKLKIHKVSVIGLNMITLSDLKKIKPDFRKFSDLSSILCIEFSFNATKLKIH